MPMIKIEHIAIWVKDLEIMKNFYCKYFEASSNQKYINSTKKFESYFLSFSSGPRLELMTRIDIKGLDVKPEQYGFTHIAIKLGENNKVDELTNKLRNDGFEVVGEPRMTGDGYYESVILDPENNRIEITA